ncbi:MAG: hypothetical protein Q3M24_22570 [Candidatus Electrothrix aestuarii]|uniref:Lipoprotein n=1 Tax=Candidatus Electrothrix aestuarii TaxID=3062594 RepID=A0AAU8LUX5_9BACT|nr:hypothetical protein [Candidatus Electrothrix aestuarii]
MQTRKTAKQKSGRPLWYTGLFLLILISLSACGPMYKTEYILEPPTSQQGKVCVMQCEQNRSQCKNNLQLAQKDCEHQNEIASIKLENCLKAGEMTCYDSRKPCPPLDFEQCNKEHRYCYQACGGKAIPQITCIDTWGWGFGCN